MIIAPNTLLDETAIKSSYLSCFTLTEFDTGKLLQYEKQTKIAAFSSMRIRISFKAKYKGENEFIFKIVNLNNAENITELKCSTSVIDKLEINSILLQNIDGAPLAYDGQYTLDFGACFNGVIYDQYFVIHSISDDTFELDIEVENPIDMRVYIGLDYFSYNMLSFFIDYI
jgi:hypothetical protein